MPAMDKDFNELIKAYTNEKSTRRLLQYSSIADKFSAILKEEKVELSEPVAVRTLRELEIERIRYFVKEYILTRLVKLNGNLFLDKRLMSHAEQKYYGACLTLLEKEDILVPNVSTFFEYVGFYCYKSLDNVKIDGEVIEILEGDFFVANIDDVLEYLERGDLGLV